MLPGPGDLRVVLVDLPEVLEGVVDVGDLVGGASGGRGRRGLVAGRAGGVSGEGQQPQDGDLHAEDELAARRHRGALVAPGLLRLLK